MGSQAQICGQEALDPETSKAARLSAVARWPSPGPFLGALPVPPRESALALVSDTSLQSVASSVGFALKIRPEADPSHQLHC